MARFNKAEHLRRNIDAIKVAFTLEKEQRRPSPEELETLRSYSGFGAIKEVIDTRPQAKSTMIYKIIGLTGLLKNGIHTTPLHVIHGNTY